MPSARSSSGSLSSIEAKDWNSFATDLITDARALEHMRDAAGVA